MSRMHAFLVSFALALASGFALSGSGGTAPPMVAPSKGTALDSLKIGQSVGLAEDAHGRFKISVAHSTTSADVKRGLYPGKVIDIGDDYVTVRDVTGLRDRLVPIYSIHSIETFRFK